MASYPRPSYFLGRSVPPLAGVSQTQPTSALNTTNPNTYEQYPGHQSVDAYNRQINAFTNQFRNYLGSDQIYGSQMQGLQGNLQQDWTNRVAQAQALQNQYGGVLPANLQGLGNTASGASLIRALSDPVLAQSAASNPFSVVNQLARQATNERAQISNRIASGGFAGSGDVASLGAGENYRAAMNRQNAATQYLQNLQGMNQGYLSNLQGAAQTQAGYANDAFTRMQNLIQSGVISATPYSQQPTAQTPMTRVAVGSQMSYEPHPTAANYYQGPSSYTPPKPKATASPHITPNPYIRSGVA